MNFNEYIITLECAQSFADAIYDLERLLVRKRDDFRNFARSRNMPWLANMSGSQINVMALQAVIKHYQRQVKQ